MLASPSVRRVPVWVKVVYSLFVAVMVPYYWVVWGPRNFLFFCDVAVLVTLVGIWRESALLISMEAVAILVPQMLWVVDVVSGCFGKPVLGMTNYMFDPTISLFVRLLSTFHGWMPFLLLWLLYRLGYDRRALPAQIVVGMTLLLICYFGFNPPISNAHGPWIANINDVYGFDEDHAQTRMPRLAWFSIVFFGIPLLFYVPTHLVLRAVFRKSGR